MPYKIFLAHNYYQHGGGEDTVFVAEGKLLQEKGHEVIQYTESNDRIRSLKKVDIAAKTLWSFDSYKKISKILETHKPDIAHFHNTFPLISPSAYYACKHKNVPVIQSLHNFRFLCPAATFCRSGNICEECLKSFFALPGIRHKCYHQSSIQTATIATMLSFHKIMKTLQNQVDAFIVGTDFMRQKFIQGGLPGEKIFIKPNFLSSNTIPSARTDDFALFVGRLVPEKGVLTLLEAWKNLDIPLKIVGDGPLVNLVNSFLKDNPTQDVEYLGSLNLQTMRELLSRARFLVFPSEWYEAFPMILIDALMNSVPVVASKVGAAETVIENEVTGLHFVFGNPQDLRAKVQWAWNNPQKMEQMGKNARQEYERKYTSEINYKTTLNIYQHVLKQKSS